MTAPAGYPDQSGWVAAGLLAVPPIVAALWGCYRLVLGQMPVHHAVVVGADGSIPGGAVPTRAAIDLVFLIGYVMALNMLIPGLIMGWVRIRRLGSAPWLRAVLLPLGTAFGVVVEVWEWGRLTSLRASGLIMLAGAGAALASAFVLLRPDRPVPAHVRRRLAAPLG